MALSPVRVLVVDDDQLQRETLRWVLEAGGCLVEEAADGRAALAALRASRSPMVVLLDLMMPEVTGVEVIEAVARDRHLATTHAYVLVTANEHILTPALRQALAALAAPIVSKPFDLDGVYDAVARAARRLGAPDEAGGPAPGSGEQEAG